MFFNYQPKGVCARQMTFEVEDGIVKSLQVQGEDRAAVVFNGPGVVLKVNRILPQTLPHRQEWSLCQLFQKRGFSGGKEQGAAAVIAMTAVSMLTVQSATSFLHHSAATMVPPPTTESPS